MRALVSRSDIAGRVRAPSSKSYTLRGLTCAALVRGESEIIHPLSSDDTDAMLNVLHQIGVGVQRTGDLWQVNGDDFHQPATNLFCAESAATLRFMTALCSLIPGRCRLTTGPSLSRRPVRPLIQALRQLGVDCSCQGEVAPVVIEGGRLKGGITELPGNVSSQFVSALLFVSPLAEEDVTIRLTSALESRSFALMTLECLNKFGIKVETSPDFTEFKTSRQTYQPARYRVEGDWSSASYFLALGTVSEGLAIENLNPHSLQGDKVMLDFLREMGTGVEVGQDVITVNKAELKAIRADLSDCIDLLPTVAVLAAMADGVSEFVGIDRARLKESNRVAAVREGLENMGVAVTEEKDRLTITGSQPKGATIDSKSDHRIAMAFSVLGSVAGGTIINEAECVSKTYPEFWDILESIGGKVVIDG
jgi:3-phosphoshikimate 1-carboxyvinyltransferase